MSRAPFEKDFIIVGDGDKDDKSLYYIPQGELERFRVKDPNDPKWKDVRELLGMGLVLGAVPPPKKSDDVTLPFIICYLLNVTALKKHNPMEDGE